MAANTRTQGANARQLNWDEQERPSRQHTGSWLPLDDLDDDPIFSGAPQLHAMPAANPAAAPTTRRQLFAPVRRAQEEVTPTRPQPTRQSQSHVNSQTSQAAPSTKNAEKVVQAKAVAIMAGLSIAAIALYAVISMAVEWAQIKLDDLQYGRPRTYQMDAYVGQNEAEGAPSHFIAMNLNRRITILQMPGGDSAKVSTIIGPYLFGQGEDLTPVQMSAQDVNGDGRPDLVVSVKNEQLLYLNDGAAFKLATPEERANIERLMKTKSQAPTNGATAGQGVGK